MLSPVTTLSEPTTTTDTYLDGLNDAQRAAVLHMDGQLLIVAGAGTGKTTVITRRIARMIATGVVKSDGVLALTFTDKAAGEMVERIENALPLGAYDLWISTFHAFCQKVLERHALDIGLPNDFALLTQTDAYLLVRKHFDRFALDYYKPRGNPTKFIHALLTHFSRLKDEAISVDQYLAYAKEMALAKDSSATDQEESSRIGELANAYHTYQQLLVDQNCLDFGDLLMYTLELFQKRPGILQKYQEQFQQIVVDEFQDTNWVQYELVKLLAGARKNVTVVGDDDQAIYKFRGASVANILQFATDFPVARRIVLTENYRSTQNILDLSYDFIVQNNPNRLEATLTAQGEEMSKKLVAKGSAAEGVIRHLHYATLDEEVRGVIETIVTLREADGKKAWSDFCILVRSNSGAIDFSLELARRGIPYQFLALKGLYGKPIILDCIAYLSLLANFHDSASVYRVLSCPAYRVSDHDLGQMMHQATKKTLSLYEVVRDHALMKELAEETHTVLTRFLGDMEKHIALAKRAAVSEVFVRFVYDSGYIKHFTKDESLAMEQIALLKQFNDRLKRFETLSPETTLTRFMDEFVLERDSGEEGSLAFDIETGPDMVRIMTVHAAKGLEYPYVFIVGMVDKRFPTVALGGDPIPVQEALIKEKVGGGDAHLEEERRLFYVAMTRAKQGLFFSSAEDYGGKLKKKLSRFMTEMGFVVEGGEKGGKVERVDGGLPMPAQVSAREALQYVIPATFSFTQLAAYAKCPLQYKFSHVLRVPILGKHQMSFGKTMHATLEQFMKELQLRQGKTQSSLFEIASLPAVARNDILPVSRDELFAMYEKAWIDDWYPDKPTKETYRKEGRRMLEEFYADAVAHVPKPLHLEKEFRIAIGGYMVKGKIDRIDSGEGTKVEIVDYKTGSPKEEGKLSSDDKKQLLLYQLAATRGLGLDVAGLTYQYLEDGSKVSFLGTEKELVKFEEDIASSIEAISNADFLPNPGMHCKFCDFANICEYGQ